MVVQKIDLLEKNTKISLLQPSLNIQIALEILLGLENVDIRLDIFRK